MNSFQFNSIKSDLNKTIHHSVRTESLVASINMTVSEIVIRDMPPEKSRGFSTSAECVGFVTKGLCCVDLPNTAAAPMRLYTPGWLSLQPKESTISPYSRPTDAPISRDGTNSPDGTAMP